MSSFTQDKLREWSLFTAGGGGGIPKITRTQNVPPLDNRELCFCPPPPNLCTEILPPPSSTIKTYMCKDIIMTIHQLTFHAKSLMKMESPWQLY